MTMTVRAAVESARDAGLCVLPPREDGSKRPDFATWTEYQSRCSTATELVGWYANGRTGIGAVMGAVSGNVELFEFDDRATFEAFVEAAIGLGLGELIRRIGDGLSEETPGGGVHWYYHCAEIAGNTDLAVRPLPPAEDGQPRRKALIETRGEGGYAVLAPSHGRVHPTGKPYVRLAGSFATIVTIAPHEREALWQLARSFDERAPQEDPTPESRQPRQPGDDRRPGDDFAARTAWDAILTPHGWTRLHSSRDKGYWRRPGKDLGWSATTNYAGSGYLYVFSSSTVFEPKRGYGKFSAYAILNHGGDFAAAARDLAAQGFGKRLDPARLTIVGRDQPPPGDISADATEAIDPHAYPLTDRGNAHLFAARSARDLRYDHRRATWLNWAGHWWRREDNGYSSRVAGLVSEWRLAALDQIEDEKARKVAYRWAQQSQSRARLDAILHLAQKVEPLAVAGDAWDSDGYRMGVANGVIDLRTGALLPGSPDESITLHSPIPYDPDATAPRWSRFLDEVFLADQELIGYVRRFAGYSLTGDTREEKLLICWGEGANGKSTLLTTLAHVAGEYGYPMPFSTVEAQRNPGGPTNDLAALAGRRLVISSEVNEGQPLNEARIKALTGGDPITARFLNREFFTFQPAAKFWLAVNHKPRVRDESKGFWRRIALLPFLALFEGAAVDQELKETLKSEAPGILAWMVQGCLEWQRAGLGAPEAIAAATQEYAEESDPLAEFIAEACVIGAQQIARGSALYHAYLDWANEQHIRERDTLSHRRFGELIAARHEKGRDSQGINYRGIGLSITWQDRKQANGRRTSV